MTSGARVLIVDDDAPARRLLQVRLRALGCEVAMAADGEEALAEIKKHEPALMMLDLQMPKMGGIEVLRHLRNAGTTFPVVVITAHGSIESAVEAMKEGACDFITKPLDAGHFDVARKAAASNATVLLLGESGAGKEIFARAIHNWSERSSQPFVAINCVGLAKELLESELFGHEKGAFTGADQLKKGKMELADGGTVFLDEIGDMSAELQTKLLRFLQEREFDRVGGRSPIRVNVRIVAATNRDLESAVKENRFREDLYHRLNVIPITLPPLRERAEDIGALAEHFLRRFAAESKKTFTALAEDALAKLTAYHWPGNVRELANVIERAVVLGSGPTLSVKDLPSRIAAVEPVGRQDHLDYREAMDATRRALVAQALAQSNGNRAAAAKALGLHEKYFLRMIKSLGIR
jgi:DNA-binding NtrC family response regulator